MSGYLPPGCTQWECDHANGADDEPPQQWFECDACDGEGIEVRGVWVYEHGCAFAHQDTEETPCRKCNGAGGWLDDAVTVEPVYEHDFWSAP